MGMLFVGTHGNVRAVDLDTGADLWTTSLPGTGFEMVTVLMTGNQLFAGSKGKLFRLDPADGSILWTNDLAGLGYEVLTLAAAGGVGVGAPQAGVTSRHGDGTR